MEIMKVRDYKAFARMLNKKTGCDIAIDIQETNHTHYQLSKDGVSIGILCIDKGEASFAPFETHDSVSDNQFINVMYMPMVDDFIQVLRVFKEIFVCELETEE